LLTWSLLGLGVLCGIAWLLGRKRRGRATPPLATMDPRMVAEIREAHLQTIERLREVERRARAERSSPTRQRTLFLQPVRDHSAWSLVCVLARSPDPVPFEIALREIHNELARRGKSASDIEEMTAMVLWATEVINPFNGRTAESGGKVHQLVADTDDLELAIDIAAERGAASDEIEGRRALVLRHAD
jgi:hypothetical protein